MLVVDGKLTMTDAEWAEFQELTFAPWKPRSPEEFNAMCDLGRARHEVENTGGFGVIAAISVERVKFGPDGEIRFPLDKRKLAYLKVHGVYPTAEQLADFEGTAVPGQESTGLSLVRK